MLLDSVESDPEPLVPVVPRQYVRFTADRPETIDAGVIGEIRFTIFIEDRELVTLMCSPWQLRALVVGFLYLEGLIESVGDLDMLRVCLEDRLADVRLAHGFPDVPPRKILTSGCTGGVSFGKYLDHIEQFRVADDDTRVAPNRMYLVLRALYDQSRLYRKSGGVHTSIFVERDGTAPRLVAEDIGRHNTLDKLPVVASRTSPTNLALAVAERLNITVCGYVRQGSMNVYTHPQRIAA